MKIEQIYTGCLAQGAYYIESEGQVAIIDPLRETSPYIERAQENKDTIRYIFETHFHADFVSGHVDLAQKTGADIIYGPGAQTDYPITQAQDGQVFELGQVKIKVLHTPGHTLESSSYLLLDEHDKPHALFTGDTLFIGDVGRPDLAQKSDLNQEDLAGMLYDSLENKIKPLPDSVIIYPAHGAGSACGKNMSKETYDTLGHQKEVNYALKAKDRASFIAQVTEGLLPPPHYFPQNVMLNKKGYDSLDQVLETGLIPLSPEKFEEIANQEGALVLDTRSPQSFADGFIPNSIFIGIDGSFAPWVGTLIPSLQQPLLLLTDPGREEEVITRLARVGYDRTLGYLEGSFAAWQAAGKEVDQISDVEASELASKLQNKETVSILDVRKPGEYTSQHVVGAQNFPLDYINKHMGKLDRQQPYYVHCAGGYRSMIAASILKARGFDHIINVLGGMAQIVETDIALEEQACANS